jgi:cytosine/adenosine deaminase-related metal-dependent hydrolase
VTLLKGALLVHLDPPKVERGDVRTAGTKIVEVGPDLAPLAGEKVVDLADKWLMPGLTCAHHHLYSALAAGMPLPSEAPANFTEMLEGVWWKLDRALDADGVEVSGLVGGVGALRAGVTTVIDHHASPSFIEGSLETLDGALDRVGLRRVLCYEVTDRNGLDGAKAGLEAHAGLLGAGSAGGTRAVMIGAHANFTVSDATLQACGAMAKEAGVGLHIHVAEAADDEQAVGEPLVARMERLGALQPGSILAHCVHLGGDELKRIEDAGAWVTHQPRSNMNNGVGYAPVASFGPNTALGTDGIGADMFTELQTGWFRGSEGGVGWFPDRWLQALTAGSRLAGDKLGVRIGVIEPGAEADLVVLDALPGPPLLTENLPAACIFRLTSSAVRNVMVAGKWRLMDRMPTRVNARELDSRAQPAAVKLWDGIRAL